MEQFKTKWAHISSNMFLFVLQRRINC